MSDIVMTDTELYDAKVNWFKEHDYVEVEPLAFYRDLYPIGSFQAKGDYSRKCGNGFYCIGMKVNLSIDIYLMI